MRLAKFLAHAGVASRRAAEALVREGRVTVDGEPVVDPARTVEDSNAVVVDGRRVSLPQRRAVFALNKPVGVVSTARDTHGRPTVVSMVPARGARLYPVGRLDADTTGLILLTDDGELAHRLTHPSFEVPRVYRARVAHGPVSERALRALRDGVRLDDGITSPARVRRVASDLVELTLHEGRKRQVRRMCAEVGHPVLTLQRVAFGPLALGDLPEGAHRRLDEAEVRALHDATQAPRPAVRTAADDPTARSTGRSPRAGS
jgi:23S rRNA pseudouridine2605 synthase